MTLSFLTSVFPFHPSPGLIDETLTIRLGRGKIGEKQREKGKMPLFSVFCLFSKGETVSDLHSREKEAETRYFILVTIRETSMKKMFLNSFLLFDSYRLLENSVFVFLENEVN